ncbi:MAG: ABC transporter ATP-binding protein [Chloroherpetonaceae bacterium]|nr:ABC transporter ATP-binding protein [Chthonomonadaceae bacterium]MDW8207192.1 ABC transporter ATP-binding protein [Chloroherpetonaceae bacterium]
MSPDADTLIDVRDLQVVFPMEERVARVVHNVSFTVRRGQTLGLVGESGCGKTMTGLALLQLIPPPGRVVSGQMLFYAKPDAPPLDIATLPPHSDAIRAIRGAQIAMVFQEPMSSLNPVYTVGQQIAEMVRLHQRLSRQAAHARAVEMLARVGIPAPHLRVNDYPHQLSGGMRQRAMIAMALSCNPKLLIADEPTTALDVTVQAQILDLIRDLQTEMGMAVLLISHDLGVIADLADEVIVMYAGQIVEHGSAEAVFYRPQHPYTRGLLRSVPSPGRRAQGPLYAIPGTVPGLLAMPAGCAFGPRCAEQFAQCQQIPDLHEMTPGHRVRCWARQESKNGA